MKHAPEWLEEFYGGLRAFDDTSWPMNCSNCGRIYADNEDYVVQTAGVNDSTGLGSTTGTDGDAQVGLYRHCLCGKILVGRFKDRRHDTPEGQKARDQFARLLEMLVEDGMEREHAREELLKLVRGRPNEIVKLISPWDPAA